jgi:hypothetical protein
MGIVDEAKIVGKSQHLSAENSGVVHNELG